MLTIDRNTVLKGPCVVLYNGQQYTSKGDVTLSPQKSLFDIDTSTFGKKTDQRLKDFYWKVSFIPAGEVTSDFLSQLFPYYATGVGNSILGSEDVTMTVITQDAADNQYVFQNAVLTKIPPLSLDSTKTAFGTVEFSCLGQNNVPFNSANRFLTIGTADYPANSYSNSDVLTVPFAGSWANSVPTGTATATEASPAVFAGADNGLVVGDTLINTVYANAALNGKFTVASIPEAGQYTLYAYGTTNPVDNTVGADSGTFTRANTLDSFDTEDGFDITHELSLTMKTSSTLGLYDIRFSSLTVTAKCIPIGPTTLDMLAALNIQGSSVLKGQSMAAEGRNLNLSGAGFYFRLAGAAVKTSDWLYSMEKNRIGSVEWFATRSFNDGAGVPLAAISTAPID